MDTITRLGQLTDKNARTLDDIFNKLPYTDDKREYTYFRMDDFF